MRELLYPNLIAKTVHAVTPEVIEAHDGEVLSLDVDGTIMPHHGDKIPDEILIFLKEIERKGYKIAFTSNAYGERVIELQQIAETISRYVEVITPQDVCANGDKLKRYRKPHPAMIHEVAARLGVRVDSVIHVGDQLFKDVVAANRAGAKSVLVSRHGEGGDPRVEYLQRPVEKLVIASFGVRSLRRQPMSRS